MSRRSRRSQRDTTDIASDPLGALLRPVARPTSVPFVSASRAITETVERDLWSQVEDRRQWSPDAAYGVAKSFSGYATMVGPGDVRRRMEGRRARGRGFISPPPVAVFAYERPKEVLVCVRRKERREVLFAERKTRKGAGGSRRRNLFSEVRC